MSRPPTFTYSGKSVWDVTIQIQAFDLFAKSFCSWFDRGLPGEVEVCREVGGAEKLPAANTPDVIWVSLMEQNSRRFVRSRIFVRVKAR